MLLELRRTMAKLAYDAKARGMIDLSAAYYAAAIRLGMERIRQLAQEGLKKNAEKKT